MKHLKDLILKCSLITLLFLLSFLIVFLNVNLTDLNEYYGFYQEFDNFIKPNIIELNYKVYISIDKLNSDKLLPENYLNNKLLSSNHCNKQVKTIWEYLFGNGLNFKYKFSFSSPKRNIIFNEEIRNIFKEAFLNERLKGEVTSAFSNSIPINTIILENNNNINYYSWNEELDKYLKINIGFPYIHDFTLFDSTDIRCSVYNYGSESDSDSDSVITVIPWSPSSSSLYYDTLPIITITTPDGTKYGNINFYYLEHSEKIGLSAPKNNNNNINYYLLHPNYKGFTFGYEWAEGMSDYNSYIKDFNNIKYRFMDKVTAKYTASSDQIWDNYFKVNEYNTTINDTDPDYLRDNYIEFTTELNTLGIIEKFINPLSQDEYNLFKPLVSEALYNEYLYKKLTLEDFDKIKNIIIFCAYESIEIFNAPFEFINYLEKYWD